MTRRVVGKVGRFALWFSPNLIALAVFAIALNWMKPSPVVAEVMNAVFVIFVLGYTIFLEGGRRGPGMRWSAPAGGSPLATAGPREDLPPLRCLWCLRS